MRPTPPRTWQCVVALVLALPLLSGCEGMPRDPEGSLERARSGVLRVGAVGAPPWIERVTPDRSVGGGTDGPQVAAAAGREAELVQGFARSIGARVVWTWGPLDEHMERLQRFELDLVAAGLTERTEWRGKVGLTTPWLEEGDHKRVLAVAPGENALLSALERYIRERAGAVRAASNGVERP
jgi:polar amino acid transport system substrate-binding protein